MKAILININKLFPFKRLLWFLTVISLIVEVLIISYSHITGYYPIATVSQFIIRLVFGTGLGLIGGLLLAFPGLIIIQYLNKSHPWNRRVFSRILIQTSFTVLWAFIVAALITLLSHAIGPYKTPLGGVIINNALISAVVNLLLTAILESWLFFIENNRAKLKAELLERELAQIRFEILKSQINPHFMFNSLNVLSGLIDSDVAKAQLFIDEFSQIYRYVLETIEKPVVTLKEELDFIRSYFFLQQIRYGEALSLSVDLPANLLVRHVPPLSLQTLLENAIKHNIVSKEQPLRIMISNDEEWLIVKNNVQSKISSGASTGLGQDNLAKRYSLIDPRIPVFTMGNDYYTVKLPLINTSK